MGGFRKVYFLVFLVILLSGCISDPETSIPSEDNNPEVIEPLQEEQATPPPIKAEDTIKIATWSLDSLDREQVQDTEKVLKIAKILSNYDIIALQGIENKYERNDKNCDNKCPSKGSSRYHPACGIITNTLSHALNSELGKNYAFEISDDVNTERYMFIYNKDKLQLLTLPYLVNDPEEKGDTCSPSVKGLMSHQPFYATFRSKNFDFVLLTFHTETSRNEVELRALESFYRELLTNPPILSERDIILLGDANLEKPYITGGCESYFQLTKKIFPHYIPSCNIPTKTGTGSVEKIIMQPETFNYEFIDSGVFKDGISSNKLSDRYLVWAEFTTSKKDDD
jgi:hypothetical protein